MEIKAKNKKKNGCIIAAIVFIVFIGIITVNSEKNNESPITTETEAKVEKTEEELLIEQKTQLEREIESIKKGIDFSTYRGTVELLQIELALFGVWGSIISEGENSTNVEINVLSTQLKNEIIKIQLSEFPTLRREYAKIINEKMWEHDIYVNVNGNKNQIINFSGGIFAANKNKKDYQDNIHETLKMFRFNQSRYRWYKEADEYTYWTIYEGKDSDIVTFK